MKQQKKNILIAEDDTNFGFMLRFFLEANHYSVTLCDNGEAAFHAFAQQAFDLCIFDVMMPLMDGFTLAEKIGMLQKNTPFIFLTAKALKEDQIKGYRAGAADYLIKPFDPEILLLKIQVLLRQKVDHTDEKLVFKIGNYVFSYQERTLALAETQEKLSPKEAELLKLLCEKQGELLTHSEAMIKIWHQDDYFTKQSMNVFITKLRKYLSHDSGHQISIENLHGTGISLKVLPKG